MSIYLAIFYVSICILSIINLSIHILFIYILPTQTPVADLVNKIKKIYKLK